MIGSGANRYQMVGVDDCAAPLRSDVEESSHSLPVYIVRYIDFKRHLQQWKREFKGGREDEGRFSWLCVVRLLH